MATELIYTLDPTRDYGDRSYDQVVTEIESGALMVIPSAKGGQPIIRQKVGGFLIKGSGRTNDSNIERGMKETKRLFMARAADDFDSVYESVVTSANKGDVRAQKLFMELYVGRPKEVSEGANEKMMDKLLDLALKPKEEVIEVISES